MKKWLVILIILTLSLALIPVACGGDDGDEEVTPTMTALEVLEYVNQSLPTRYEYPETIPEQRYKHIFLALSAIYLGDGVWQVEVQEAVETERVTREGWAPLRGMGAHTEQYLFREATGEVIQVTVAAIEEEEVVASIFPDANLEAAVRDALLKHAGEEITMADLAELTSLTAQRRGIIDLSGIEHCTNLNNLYLSGNQISDISPLFSLTNLNRLYLAQNQITDISPLVENSGLGEGDSLTLGDNPLDVASRKANIPELEGRGVRVWWP